jgi:hypothetical protein
MCTVSYVSDYARREWEDWVFKPQPGTTGYPALGPYVVPPKPVSREEFEELKAKVEELKTLLLAAKAYDEKTGQPHCEAEDKVAVLKKIADYFGVDLKEVFDD